MKENDESILSKDLLVPLIQVMIWRVCTWPLPKCWRHRDDCLIWVALSLLSNWKANSESKEIYAKIQFVVTTWWLDGKDYICPPPTLTPEGGIPSDRLHREAVPENGIASFWKGDTLCLHKVCEIDSTFHGWHMKSLSCPVKTTKSVSKGKRFYVVWEPPSMKLPSDYSWSLLGERRVTGWTWKTSRKSV